ncbi:uncharacterized protein LOC106131595 [Amyelois transitella]|uniref:uncharacterized protein LOC106131595 n=1 Tax=Amyelois transitella TaxID=680683 RepID=UPI0029903C11|nr:uncharacterized protein LOC106131595 [Amyelois transitella]
MILDWASCLCLVLILSTSSGGPLHEIISNYFEDDGSGNYEFGWQKGIVKYINNQPILSVTGGFAYFDEIKNVLKVTNFKADENGYQPEESEGPGGIPGRLGAGAAG